MAFKSNAALRALMAQALADGLAGGTLRIRTGGVAGTGNADTGTVLATITLPSPAFTVSGGVLSKSGSWDDPTADATGTAGHWRITHGSNVCEGTCGSISSGADMELSDTLLVMGTDVSVDTCSITVGA